MGGKSGVVFFVDYDSTHGLEHAVPEIWFIIFAGFMQVFMQVPDAAAQRDPQFDKIDLALPFIAAAVLCVGVRIDDDTASLIILTSLVILCARARVGDHDSPNASGYHRRFGIGVAIFLSIFMG